MRAVRRFLQTPKGLLTIVLAMLTAMASLGGGIELVAPRVAGAVAAAAVIDALILRKKRKAWEFPDGAVLTGLFIAMVLGLYLPWYVAACTSAIAILSKHIVRTRTAHVFNPAALAMVASFYLFDAGESWWGALPDMTLVALIVIFAAGVFIADRVNKVPMVLAFLGSYYLLFTATAFLGDPRSVARIFRPPDLQMVLFFAFFFPTDPPTSPVKYPDQVVYGAIVAAAAYAVFEVVGQSYHLFAGVLAGNVWEAWRRRYSGTDALAIELEGAIAIGVLLALAGARGGAAHGVPGDREWTSCRNANPDISIAGSTEIIRSGREEGTSLASALSSRGVAYLALQDSDRAIQDFAQAIKTDPARWSPIAGRKADYWMKRWRRPIAIMPASLSQSTRESL